ncbi:hypothetical protein [Haloarcula marina]|uniref:DUF7845 domain-containing protein n=1 Tax=Haloarcula marina TaxID=2961574 RepID=UPI0020B63A7E|nr:hypothetical protein [Halomicroarcula marina]
MRSYDRGLDQHKEVIDLQTHRIGANLVFDEGGPSPYWAVVSQYEPDLEDRGETFVFNGTEYEIVRSTHWTGKIDTLPSATFDGTMNEYKLGMYAADDENDELGADFTFRPGFPKARHIETGELISVMPTQSPESIRVQVESTNLSQFEVLGLVQSLASPPVLQAG